MPNHIEKVTTPEGVVSFDHSTGIMSAVWNNGYTETWPRRGYSIAQKLESFLRFTGQYDRINHAD